MAAPTLAWFFLLLAGFAEIGWAVGLKYTEGFTRPLPTVLTIAGMIVSFYLLSLAMRSIPLGTAYAAWTGIGAVGTVILGMVLFGESRDLARIGCIALIVGGVVGLKWLSGSAAH
ncbi:quaternary ammonium compound efflux SMR transporter SugE [Dokdonella sp.]|uniref:quaternary ammonium compound efflux SMR transporter SugE n=1 Tax=Dokdonella sp. TaxID=2291710 RepID=UPI001B081FFA|nr:quaternary ammonium compound efflux SMR transporter SugE [Dokdonella sp.]MBO9663326.1 quaternary ammonium compound efflux SMR transporter SugE [Dokdonella sp.]